MINFLISVQVIQRSVSLIGPKKSCWLSMHFQIRFSSHIWKTICVYYNVGVPKANIENAIKSAGGKGADCASSELVVYDAQGPTGYHMIIEAITENNRKTRPEIKNLLAKYS